MSLQKIYKKGEIQLRHFGIYNKHSNIPESLINIQKQRNALKERIKAVKNRLTFGYSEPLHQYRIILMKEDMQLLCEMTKELIRLNQS